MGPNKLLRIAALCSLLSLFIALSTNDVLAAQTPMERQIGCDPVINGVASFIMPGWGQALNGESGRKPLVHFGLGLGLSLAVIYFWGSYEGDLARVARILWSVISGFEAYGTCARFNTPQPLIL